MSEKDILEIIKKQQTFFNSNQTLDINFRVEYLKKLKQNIKIYEPKLLAALNADLGKSEFEAFSTEIGMVQHELSYHIKKIGSWSKPKRVSTPLFAFPSLSYIYKQPYGNILVISPFNYPFMLAMTPLIAAVSAGNTVVLKPSEFTTNTSKVIEKIITDTFLEAHVRVIQGGVEVSQQLLAQRWDKIFFTGSTKVGKIVLTAAAKNLTPVVLELGGKNPVIVDKDAKLKIAAKRIIWGKFINAGQSCVAPDYIYVHSDVKDKFLRLLKEVIQQFFTKHPEYNKEFPLIINKAAIQRLESLLEGVNVYFGGESDSSKNYFSPTILTEVTLESPVMKNEIFGPILPVLSYTNLDEIIQTINRDEKPLSLYYFSENRKKQKEVLKRTFSGDAGINEVVMHFTNLSLPFGGVGFSGMGSYHGKSSFDVFTHERSVMKTNTKIDLPLRYPPYKSSVLKLLRVLFK